jgi:hypothetical protein
MVPLIGLVCNPLIAIEEKLRKIRRERQIEVSPEKETGPAGPVFQTHDDRA